MRLKPWSVLIVIVCGVGALTACRGDGDTSATRAAEASEWRQHNPMLAVTYSRQPMPGRQEAVERLLAEDAGRFWAQCAAKARQIDDWPMILLLSDKAEQSRDNRALQWLVRSWAMPSTTVSDETRPEPRAIEAITRAKADVLLKEILFDKHDSYPTATQIAAWTVLFRLLPQDELRGLVVQQGDEDASVLMSMLKQCEPAVDVLPADREAIGRLMRLTTAFDKPQWSVSARWRSDHAGDGPATLALRHLPALLHMDDQAARWTRTRWLDHLKKRLADRRHVSRGDGADEFAVVSKRPDRFGDHVDRLGMADMVVLDHLLDAMDNPAIRRSLFEHADADRVDRRSEYGGVLGWAEQGGLAYRSFDPLFRRHDEAYLASTRCMQALYVGLAHVHFHAQKYDNALWAGPGKGDLGFAKAHYANAVVLTFVDQNTMNVDAYWADGVIIDLGCVTR